MRKPLLIFTLALCLLGFRNSFAQSTTTMQDILETVNKKVVQLEEKDDQEIVNITLDLLVNKGSKKVYRYLDPAYNYTMEVFGDRRVENLKVQIYKKPASGEWEYVSGFTDKNPFTMIYPKSNEQYEFTVSVEGFKEDYSAGHFALLLYHIHPDLKK